MEEHSENSPQMTPPPRSEHKKQQCQTQNSVPLQPSPPNSQKRSMTRLGKFQFSMEQRLGSGMSGDTYVGVDTQTLQLVCIKVVDREVYKTADQKVLLQNEIRCQQICASEYTIRILDVFDTASFCFIVTELCEGGDLYRILRASTNGLPEGLVACFGWQIATALKKLKDVGIVHRDVKSENILLQRGICKLGDFGFAVQQSKLGKEKFNLGSPLYMSLQALERSEYSYASDVFAFGVVLFEMLHKESPWECSEELELIERLKNDEPEIKSGVSQQMRELITKCLKRKPEERLTIEEILCHGALREIPSQ